MRVTIEILQFADGQQPKVLHAISHEAHLIEPVAAAARGVINSQDLPERADGYRIVTEEGTEFWGWPDRAASS